MASSILSGYHMPQILILKAVENILLLVTPTSYLTVTCQ